MDASGPRQYIKRPIDLPNLWWTARIVGELLEVKSHEIDSSVRNPKKRGPIKGFSRSARLRMCKRVATIDWRRVKCGLFVTLTWPCETFHLYEKLRNQARDQFVRDMENHLGRKINVLWRIEWKRRKTGRYRGKFLPHFHLIICNVRFVDKYWIKDTWKRCVQARWKVVTWVDRLEDEKKHAIYIAKYCAKQPDSSVLDDVAYLNTPGRHWGQHRPSLLPVRHATEFQDLDAECVDKLRDLAQEQLKYYDKDFDSGFCIFGKDGRQRCLEAWEILLDARAKIV